MSKSDSTLFAIGGGEIAEAPDILDEFLGLLKDKPDARIVVFPDAPSGLEGVRAGRADAFAGTSLTVNSLLARAGSRALERAAPFKDPVIEGKRVRGYGAFGFRKEDRKLIEAFNKGLAQYIGTPAHLETVKPFGFTAAELPQDATAAALCAG